MKHRKLRIAFSAVCGILCLMLIALWVRSYWWMDLVIGKHGSINSLEGCMLCAVGEDPKRQHVVLFSQNLNELRQAGSVVHSGAMYGFHFQLEPQRLVIGLPHWLLAIAAAGLAAAAWLRWRFSLRTLLIGMTLIAVALGLIFAALPR